MNTVIIIRINILYPLKVQTIVSFEARHQWQTRLNFSQCQQVGTLKWNSEWISWDLRGLVVR